MKHEKFLNTSFPARALRGVVPNKVLDELMPCIEKYEIHTPNRLAHFMSQCAHESGGFGFVIENMNYSAQALLSVFGRYFTEEEAREYERQPEKIANRVYANRMGNGDENSGDGWLRRGRGYIQLTGAHNQTAFFRSIGLPEDSDPILISNVYPLQSAAWFWNTNSLNDIADNGGVREVTRRVNGGYNGLEDREMRYVRFLGLLI